MNDDDYVVCGRDLVKLEPSAELRWHIKAIPMPGRSDIAEMKPILQQKWTASSRMPDGDTWTEFRWRDVPTG